MACGLWLVAADAKLSSATPSISMAEVYTVHTTALALPTLHHIPLTTSHHPTEYAHRQVLHDV